MSNSPCQVTSQQTLGTSQESSCKSASPIARVGVFLSDMEQPLPVLPVIRSFGAELPVSEASSRRSTSSIGSVLRRCFFVNRNRKDNKIRWKIKHLTQGTRRSNNLFGIPGIQRWSSLLFFVVRTHVQRLDFMAAARSQSVFFLRKSVTWWCNNGGKYNLEHRFWWESWSLLEVVSGHFLLGPSHGCRWFSQVVETHGIRNLQGCPHRSFFPWKDVKGFLSYQSFTETSSGLQFQGWVKNSTHILGVL